jgi:hypothetical protein
VVVCLDQRSRKCTTNNGYTAIIIYESLIIIHIDSISDSLMDSVIENGWWWRRSTPQRRRGGRGWRRHVALRENHQRKCAPYPEVIYWPGKSMLERWIVHMPYCSIIRVSNFCIISPELCIIILTLTCRVYSWQKLRQFFEVFWEITEEELYHMMTRYDLYSSRLSLATSITITYSVCTRSFAYCLLLISIIGGCDWLYIVA